MPQTIDKNSEQKRTTAFQILLSLFKISSSIPIVFSTKTTDNQLIFTKPSHVLPLIFSTIQKTTTMINLDQNKGTTHLWGPY